MVRSKVCILRSAVYSAAIHGAATATTRFHNTEAEPKGQLLCIFILGEGEVQEDNNGKLNPSHFAVRCEHPPDDSLIALDFPFIRPQAAMVFLMLPS